MRPKLGPGEKGARERLVDAFWERARVRPVSGITVDELCAAVGCRRSTFYYHFGGIDELRRSALERTELPALLADEFAATMARRGKLPRGRYLERARELDDVCTFVHLNWGELGEWGVPERLEGIWFEATGTSRDGLSATGRAVLAFATHGFLGALAYRGSTGNAFPYEKVAAEMHRAVVPALAEAITGISPSERCE